MTAQTPTTDTRLFEHPHDPQIVRHETPHNAAFCLADTDEEESDDEEDDEEDFDDEEAEDDDEEADDDEDGGDASEGDDDKPFN